MSEQKTYTFRPPLYHGHDSTAKNGTAPQQESEGHRVTEQQSWDAYRKWLSRVSARPVRERNKVDHSIYTWNGYNNWADKVKRSWTPEDSES